MFRKRILISLLIPVLLLSMAQVAFGSELNFSVSSVIPENQIDKDQSYFDLHMKPNQQQTLEIIMRNDTKTDVIVEINVNTAMTNNNGIIDYSQTDFERDPSLKIDLEDLATYEEEVIIKANSTVTYPLNVKMPDEEISGIVLGGIHFQEKEDEEERNSDEAQIRNTFAYIIGLKMSMNDIKVEPSLELNEVKPTQINYRNAVTTNIQNTEPLIISPLEIKANIFKEKGKDVLFTSENKDIRMAPNSNFNFPIKWDNKEFKPGKYRLELTAKNEENEWAWEEFFTIEGNEAKTFNKEAVELEKDYTLWYVIGGSIILIILLALFYWLGTRRKDTES